MAKKREGTRTTTERATRNAAGWLETLLASQLGRQILAEALVAGAGAAASVLAARRRETAGVSAPRSGGALLQEAARSAAGAVTGVLSSMASDALGAAAKAMLSGSGRARSASVTSQRKAAR